MLRSVAIAASLSLFLFFPTGCDESAVCDDCGGTLDEGYLFDYVSTEDMQDLAARAQKFLSAADPKPDGNATKQHH